MMHVVPREKMWASQPIRRGNLCKWAWWIDLLKIVEYKKSIGTHKPTSAHPIIFNILSSWFMLGRHPIKIVLTHMQPAWYKRQQYATTWFVRKYKQNLRFVEMNRKESQRELELSTLGKIRYLYCLKHRCYKFEAIVFNISVIWSSQYLVLQFCVPYFCIPNIW